MVNNQMRARKTIKSFLRVKRDHQKLIRIILKTENKIKIKNNKVF